VEPDVYEEQHLAHLSDFDYFGEQSLLNSELANAVVRTTQKTALFYLPRNAFEQMLEDYPAVRDALQLANQTRHLMRTRRYERWLTDEETVYLISRKHLLWLVARIWLPVAIALFLLLAIYGVWFFFGIFWWPTLLILALPGLWASLHFPEGQRLEIIGGVAIVVVSLLISVVFALGGGLVWLVARALRIRSAGWKIFKGTLFSLVLFLPVFVFLITPVLLSYWVSGFGTRPPERRLTDTPADYGNDFIDVEFPSRDGLMLRGWLMKGEETKPTLIFGHGLFRSRREGLERGSALNKRGFSVLLFDFRNHGESDGRSTSLGFLERLDVLGAYDFLKEKRERRRFVLLGVSMGAVAVIHAAGDFQQDLEAIIADSPFQSLNETVAHHVGMLSLPSFPFANLFIWNLTRITQYAAEDLNTLEALRRLDETPVLLIYGKEDRRLPPFGIQNIFDAIPSAKKELVVFENATHGAAYRINPELYVETVVEFLEEAHN
ncbi:MAG: alpha/beta fold hydrolase, partial [Acidobacteria bacterium]|nr:alpha/beta fold hydrolase [Acidobacteriota bacterium]